MKKFLFSAVLMGAVATQQAQNAKIQTAWRAMEAFKSTKDPVELKKAKDAIDLAIVHEETKNSPKAWLRKTEISYAYFTLALMKEMSAQSGDNDNKKRDAAYAAVSTADLIEASNAVAQAKKLDTKKDFSSEINAFLNNLTIELNNVALGKFNQKKYDDAMVNFDQLYDFYASVGVKDTTSINNALISAVRAKNPEKTKLYSEKMIVAKLASSYAYQTLFDAQLALKDTTAALTTLKTARTAYPNDTYLMNRETEFYLQQGKQSEAMGNLDKAIEKDPGNFQLYLVRGNVYDNLANPKKDGKDAPKPANFEEFISKAEKDYLKAGELNPKNFDTFYNLGALYNNWAGEYQNKADKTPQKNAAEIKNLEAKSKELLNKAIPQLEKALEINPTDRSCMHALKRLYLMVGNQAKADELGAKMKK